ncbi:MAG: RluA family pseudouridine synthase, partial [Eubacterium sp.]|nr:RluA family pseudouridine synthase [Eubacterium sp.]
YYPNASLLEVKLHTGRTHQIRAHLANIGHPLNCDGIYGKEKGRYRQALYSYKLHFNFSDKNCLDYLNSKTFQANNIELLDDYKERKFR